MWGFFYNSLLSFKTLLIIIGVYTKNKMIAINNLIFKEKWFKNYTVQILQSRIL